jgi:hypothetical protein
LTSPLDQLSPVIKRKNRGEEASSSTVRGAVTALAVLERIDGLPFKSESSAIQGQEKWAQLH